MHLRDGLQTHPTVAGRYDHRVASGAIRRDPAQAPVIAALDSLLSALAQRQPARKSSALGWLFARKNDAAAPLSGLYICGGVGRGKTFLMDMFFEIAPVRAKRRAHFNDFMADVHDRIQRQRQARKEGLSREDDPIPPVAQAIAASAQLLCFDEFAVTDIADAMILSRLFSALFAAGVVLVATSNVEPDDLYRDGLNRGLFEPFIALLKRHASVLTLESETDHRLEKLGRTKVYLSPSGPETDRAMNELWRSLTHGQQAGAATVTVKGRTIAVPMATDRAARFTFAALCEAPLAARDYLAITARFPTLFVERIPVLGEGRRNEAKRLILFIDTAYDAHTRLVVSAETPPEGIYAGRTGTEAFEFERTKSRLIEMQSQEWLQACQGLEAARDSRPTDAAKSVQIT